MAAFSAKLVGCRNRSGLSQTELAKAIGVSLRTIQNWEGGETRPPGGEKVRRLAAVLGVPIAYLLEEDPGQAGNSSAMVLNDGYKTEREVAASALERDCRAHLDAFLHGCHGDQVRLGWTLVELRVRFPLSKFSEEVNGKRKD